MRVVRVVRHLMRVVWGDDLDPALRPVLGVTLIGSAAGSAMWTFMSIWAVEELGAKAALPFALLVVGDHVRRTRRLLVARRERRGDTAIAEPLEVAANRRGHLVLVALLFHPPG